MRAGGYLSLFLPTDIVQALRSNGFQVVRVVEAGMEKASDDS